jgi:hypothetical protein
MVKENERHAADIDRFESDLAQLNARGAELDAELMRDPLKRDAVRLYEQIAQVR